MEENNNVEVTPKKSNPIILIVLAIILLAGIGFGVWYFLGGNSNNKEEDEIVNPDADKIGEKGKVEETTEVELKDETAKAKLNDYITILSSGSYRLEDFLSGKNLTEKDMIYFTLHYMFNKEMYRVVTEDPIPAKYQQDAIFAKAYLDVEAIWEVNVNTFAKDDSGYGRDKIKITETNIKDAGTAPCVGIVDTELKVMYFNNAACGEGISPNTYLTKVKKMTATNNNYYVYLTVAKKVTGTDSDGFYKISDDSKVDVTEFDGNEDKFETLRWTFDKNYKFVESKLTPTESPFIR